MSATQENKLFVTEEEDVTSEPSVKGSAFDRENGMDFQSQDELEGEDAVIQEIPLNLAGQGEVLHILQYANKPKKVGKRVAEHPFISAARYKNASSVWELDIPLDETAFYNKNKADGEWADANTQTLRGVGVENKGQYAGFVADGQIYLTPVEKITQLRPNFKYIDSLNQQRRQDDSRRNVNPASQKAQVVTMSVKSVNDPVQHRLAGSLLAHKVEEEEKFADLTWVEDAFEQFKDSVVADCSTHTLKALGDEQNYLENLV
ncbi:related to DNA-directed RNA polymerase III subunit RPC5 [Zygosaccharomyces bailii]|uniref:ZYBA0S07-00694g1_1 n=1 Tax=Zygosaccharomyces bailii (strain CLIB 213 / ATCC 58445 / CBS 680 / BCRC 21525 / NBRC 1098 / NCYC 1416 / NRRL Y-2227) TaxID=1333698 RepID=A0A8J2T8P4_ZYGB2|nr:ZYBA0S07-00694g1_1 [Zygosaccharomyces bailii CLIB 213]CDH10812.1 related to DNA-directed RNA polymerase III subunit RPC5 [Zygosaccharomyces bailii ISA1307]SJM83935.1 related to DNA-directed RNA polymerase III subunit RPC5 [Zygosaccharomyces bailii]